MARARKRSRGKTGLNWWIRNTFSRRSDGRLCRKLKRLKRTARAARDKNGNLAAATSTGGTTNKRPGRVGDTPVIGAGTYANNATCAVSATGDGEYFIRATVGRDVSALMEYRGMSLKDAAQVALDRVAKLGGTGGLIAIDREGNIVLPFNTAGMYRGYVDPNGKFAVEIYK